ncbi:hypothetical protein IFM89_026112 [Coptis chinensis]|uniref:Pectinesterase catalytic domain-containing protein n=1 Tax=Coptis chinensis TaxID=261450 RepID=A0A835M445_9MAGN|nr:hypothetical protein IFM89_026112 [Coptis chinensis]
MESLRGTMIFVVILYFSMKSEEGFPTWMKARDRGPLQGPVKGITTDVVVAQDGFGDFRTIMEMLLLSWVFIAFVGDGWTTFSSATFEFENYGPGYSTTSRVKWSGYHQLNDSRQATKFTISEFIQGELWLPSTGIEFIPGLSD